MYSPKANAWVEIYNDTDEAVDLSQYKILDSGATIKGHNITFISGASPVAPHAYAVIATSGAIDKFGTLPWTLFKAALAFKFSPAETIALKLGEALADTVTFTSTEESSNGNSLQKINGAWVGTVPTPGAENKISYKKITTTTSTKITTPQKIITEAKADQLPIAEAQGKSVIEDIPLDKESTRKNKIIFPIISLVLIGAASYAVYLIRRKKTRAEPGSDFEIIE